MAPLLFRVAQPREKRAAMEEERETVSSSFPGAGKAAEGVGGMTPMCEAAFRDTAQASGRFAACSDPSLSPALASGASSAAERRILDGDRDEGSAGGFAGLGEHAAPGRGEVSLNGMSLVSQPLVSETLGGRSGDGARVLSPPAGQSDIYQACVTSSQSHTAPDSPSSLPSALSLPYASVLPSEGLSSASSSSPLHSFLTSCCLASSLPGSSSSCAPSAFESVVELLPQVYIQQLERQLGDRREAASAASDSSCGKTASEDSLSHVLASSASSVSGNSRTSYAKDGPRPESGDGRAGEHRLAGVYVQLEKLRERKARDPQDDDREADPDGRLTSVAEETIKKMETEAMKAALEGRREDEAELREQLQTQRERGLARRKRRSEKAHDEGVQWELENVLATGFQVSQVVSRINELEGLQAKLEAETMVCVRRRQDELVSNSRAVRELEEHVAALQSEAAETRELLRGYRQRLLVPSLRVVQQQKKQEEQQERLRLLLQIQKVAALNMALEECRAQRLLPLSASLLMEALSLPVVASGGNLAKEETQGAADAQGRRRREQLESDQDDLVIHCVREAKKKLLESLASLRASIDGALELASQSLPPAMPASAAPALSSPLGFASSSACPWAQYRSALAAASLLPPSMSVGEMLASHLVSSAEKVSRQILLAFLPASLFSSLRGDRAPPEGRESRQRTVHRREASLILRERAFFSSSGSEDRDSPAATPRRDAAREPELVSLARLAKRVKPQDSLSCLVKILEAHMDLLLGLSALMEWHQRQIADQVQFIHARQKRTENGCGVAPSSTASITSPSSRFSSTAPETSEAPAGVSPAPAGPPAAQDGGREQMRSTLDVAADVACRARDPESEASLAASLHFVSLLFHVYYTLRARRRQIWGALQRQFVEALAHVPVASLHFCPDVGDIVSLIHGVYAYLIGGCRLCCVRDAGQEEALDALAQTVVDVLARAPKNARVSSHLRAWVEARGGGVDSRQGRSPEDEAAEGSLLPSRSVVVEELHRQLARLLDALQREQLRSLLHLLEEETWQRLPVPSTFALFHFGLHAPPAPPLEVYGHPRAALFRHAQRALSWRLWGGRKEDLGGAASAAAAGASGCDSESLPPFFLQPFPPALPPFPYALQETPGDASRDALGGRKAPALPEGGGGPSAGRGGASRDPLSALLPKQNCFRGWAVGAPLPGAPSCLYTDELPASSPASPGHVAVDNGGRSQSPVVSLSSKLAAKELSRFFRLSASFPLMTFPSVCAAVNQAAFYVTLAAGVALPAPTFASLLTTASPASLLAAGAEPSAGRDAAGDMQTRRKLLDAADAALLQARSPYLGGLLVAQEARVQFLFDEDAQSRAAKALRASSPHAVLIQRSASLGVFASAGFAAAGVDDERAKAGLEAAHDAVFGASGSAASPAVQLSRILKPMPKQTSPGALWGAAERATAVDSAADLTEDLARQFDCALGSASAAGWLASRLTAAEQAHVRGALRRLQRAAAELRAAAFLTLAGHLCDSAAFICALLRAAAADFPSREASDRGPASAPVSSSPGALAASAAQPAACSVSRALESQRGLLRDLTRRLRCAAGGAISAQSQRDIWRAVEARSILDCVEVLSAAPLPPAPAVNGLSPGALLSLADALRAFLKDVRAMAPDEEAAAREASGGGVPPLAGGALSSPVGGPRGAGRGRPEGRGDARGGLCAPVDAPCSFSGIDLAFLDGFTEAIAMSAEDVLHWCRYQQKRTVEVSPRVLREETGAAAATGGDRRAGGGGRDAAYSLRVLSNALLRMEGFGYLPTGKAAEFERKHLSLLAKHGQKLALQQSPTEALPGGGVAGVRQPPPGADAERQAACRRDGSLDSGAKCLAGGSSFVSQASHVLHQAVRLPGERRGAAAARHSASDTPLGQLEALDAARSLSSQEDLNRYLKQLDQYRRTRAHAPKSGEV
ncbi:hypothetical protein BESB_059130 [Besnoitia besnoiti]|uniref:Uncharacterized protein n=1 Tax=Besnoitia besnoiti TaxID=94643 RepID=A0A2A9MGC8_BESBE|nr:hypothetical protein BESB_059130 [Besnoitia besnoiti]PFH35026.1 hypothetical protein BESB_059130 [Besnoitia besnoiti]